MSTDWITSLGLTIVDSSVRVTVVAAAVATILLVCRVRDSRLVHATWAVVVFAMLLMPLLVRLMPVLPVPAPMPPFVEVVGVLPAVPDLTIPPRQTPAAGALPTSTGTPTAVEPVGRPSQRRPNWVAIIVGIHAFGALALLVRLAAGWISMARLKRRATLVPVDPSFYESDAVTAPVTIGIVRPQVLLPRQWREWPEDKVSAVLAHELTHIARRDPVTGFFARLNRCVFWFHPLAWWLERKLAATAEDACDDAAVKRIGQSRRYAEILLDMAQAVHERGGRLQWDGVGVRGSELPRRIERILRGALSGETSRALKLAIGVVSGVIVLFVGGWKYQPELLRGNPDVTARQAAQEAERAFYEAARSMTPEQLAEVVHAWKANQEDFTALNKILIYYVPDYTGQPKSNQAEIVEARRGYILWLIDRHPEHELTGSWLARIYPTPLDPYHDPQGYQEAKRLWLMHANRSDISSAALSNGARFFEVNDNELAERLLLRAQEIDPRPEWSGRLGRLYAFVIMGANSSMPLNVLRSVSVEDSRSAFAQEVRRKLEASKDPRLLAEAGRWLLLARQFFEDNKVRLDFDPVVLGAAFVSRALQLDPTSAHARSLLGSLDGQNRQRQLRQTLRGADGRALPREKWPEAVATLPDRARFELLSHLADQEYSWAEHLEYTKKDAAGAAATWARSKTYARDALALSSMFTDHPEYAAAMFRIHMALGTHALREGDRHTAVHHLLEAVRTPGTRTFGRVDSLEVKLVHYLLKAGERESILEFLETGARIRPEERERLLKDAAALRRGEMPEVYQLRLAAGH